VSWQEIRVGAFSPTRTGALHVLGSEGLFRPLATDRYAEATSLGIHVGGGTDELKQQRTNDLLAFLKDNDFIARGVDDYYGVIPT